MIQITRRVTKTVCKDFKVKHLHEYDDLYVQSNTLLLTDVSEDFRNTFLEAYELDPLRLLNVPIIA